MDHIHPEVGPPFFLW